MRDANPDGICDYADRHPLLSGINFLAVDLYYQALGTAEIISAKRKDFKYVKPSELESLMNFYQIPADDRPEMLAKISLIQEIDNERRPIRPKPKSR